MTNFLGLCEAYHKKLFTPMIAAQYTIYTTFYTKFDEDMRIYKGLYKSSCVDEWRKNRN